MAITLMGNIGVLLDTVYMLVGKTRNDIIYSPPATTAKECWERYASCRDVNGDYILGTGADVKYLRKLGYRAVRVDISAKRSICRRGRYVTSTGKRIND